MRCRSLLSQESDTNITEVRRSSHHTNSTTNENRSYEWVFREYIQPFKVVINWLASVIEKERMKRIVVPLNELDRKIWPNGFSAVDLS